MKASDKERQKRLEKMRDKFVRGQLLGREDFKAVGFNEVGTKHALIKLRDEYMLDILVVCRGKALIGWILADEVL